MNMEARNPAAGNPVAQLLVSRKQLTVPDLERAEQLASTTGVTLEAVLSRLGLVSDHEVAEAMASALGLELIAAERFPSVSPLRDRVSPAFLRNACLLPLVETADVLDVAMADPRDDFAVNALRMLVRKEIRCKVSARGEIERALDRLSAAPAAADVALRPTLRADIDLLTDAASGAPAVAYVQTLLTDAVRLRASDIHLEPIDGRLDVRRRIDGRLTRTEAAPAGLAEAIVGRIKVLSGLDIAERRLPQDGRARISVDGREIDIRVATLPTMSGESVALRILDRTHLRLDVEALGFSAPISAGLLRTIERPHGILLVTGPTGSGKTTTLYALLQRLNKPDVNILTVEDPVEFRLPGVHQVRVRHGIGLGFARVMRAFLRNDPDIMMVGEIRDAETAGIAIQAALTGHLILSTLHTNDAPGAATRLIDMGIEPFLLAATVKAILAQRLVRLLCPHCRERYTPSSAEIAYLQRHAPALAVPQSLYRARGCGECGGSGYHGRAAIGELLILDDEMQSLIAARADYATLLQAARRKGMISLAESALAKVADGVTSLEEALRIAPES